MIADIQIEEQPLSAPLVQTPVQIVQDMDLLHVGGGMNSGCHF